SRNSGESSLMTISTRSPASANSSRAKSRNATARPRKTPAGTSINGSSITAGKHTNPSNWKGPAIAGPLLFSVGALVEEDLLGLLVVREIHGLILGERDGEAACDGRTRLETGLPGGNVGEFREVDTLSLPAERPAQTGHVGDRILICDIIAAFELLVQHAVEAVGLVAVTVYGVRDFFGRIDAEVMVLAEHRAKTAHLPE